MRDHATLQLEGRVGCILRRGSIRAAGFIPAPRNMRGAQAGNRLHGAKQIIQNITPVTQHVHDDSAAVLFAVIPGGALRLRSFSVEDPISELAADGKYPAEETAIAERP